MDGGGVVDNYLEGRGYPILPYIAEPRTPIKVGGVSPFEDNRRPYTYGASRPSLRPLVNQAEDDVTFVSFAKPRPRKRRRSKRYVSSPKRAPFKLQPAYRKPVLGLAPPPRSVPDVPGQEVLRVVKPSPRPAPGYQPPTGADLLDDLNELGTGPFPETVYPPNKKGFR